LIQYPANIRFRNILRMKGNELEPMIQIEARVGSRWLCVVRCDRSHDFLHLDLFYRNGQKKKRRLQSQNSSDAIVEAMEILKQEGRELFEELQYPEIAQKFAENQDFIKRELENAKKFLLNEAKHPERIKDMRGEGITAYGVDAIFKKE
jgi:hypothetical protein